MLRRLTLGQPLAFAPYSTFVESPLPWDVVALALDVLRGEAHGSREGPHTVELVMQNANFSEGLARQWLRRVYWKVAPPAPGELAELTRTLQAFVPASGVSGSAHHDQGAHCRTVLAHHTHEIGAGGQVPGQVNGHGC